MSKRKNVLLLGSSYSAMPILKEIRRAGHSVTVVGSIKADPCHAIADFSIFEDYSKPEELFKYMENKIYDYVVPTCNDISYITGAVLAERYELAGFDSLDNTKIIHNKSFFREFLSSINVSAPRHRLSSNNKLLQLSDLIFPILVKPVDSFSGRGMTLVKSISELEQAFKTASDSSNENIFVLEEFINGTLHSHSAFIENSKILNEYFVDEFCTVYPYQVDCSNHPSFLSELVKNKVRESISSVIRELNLVDGLLHTQFITSKQEVYIIESMRRCPGDLYPKLVEDSTGESYISQFVSPFIGCPVGIKSSDNECKLIGRHTISSPSTCIGASFTCNLNKKIEVVPLKLSSQKLEMAPYDKLAIIFTEFQSKKEMKEITENFNSYVSINEF